MRVRDQLRAHRLRLVSEDSMRSRISRNGSKEIVGPPRFFRFFSLLLIHSDFSEVAIEKARGERVGDDGLRRPPPDVQLASRIF